MVPKVKVVILVAFVLPLTTLLWIISLGFHFYKPEHEFISPPRALFSVLAPLLIAYKGLQKGSLNLSGAIAGVFVGFVLTISNFCFFAALLTFFVTGSKATKFRSQKKRKLEEDFKEGGQRNWIQVLCNGGVAAEFALLYMIDVGCKESVIDFSAHYNSAWYSMAVLGSLACCAGDTLASEIGAVMGSSQNARLILGFSIVPKGTNGGVSVIGTLASVVGGALVGLAYYVTLLVFTNTYYLESVPPQWMLVPAGALFGFVGSLIDSLLGATLQYSGFDKEKGCIVEKPGPSVKHICGTNLLDNHSVNLLSSFLTGLLAPRLAFSMWSYFNHR